MSLAFDILKNYSNFIELNKISIMRKLLFISLLLILSACNDKAKDGEEKENQHTIIAGTISNPINEFIEIRRDDYENDTIKIDTSGSFVIVLNPDEFEYINLKHDKINTTLFLTHGDSVNVKYDASDYNETVSFTGTNIAENQYLKEKAVLKAEIRDKFEPTYILNRLSAKEFILKMDSIHNPVEALINDFDANNELNKNFSFNEKETVRYDKATDLLLYSFSFDNHERDSLDQLPENFDSYLESTNLNEERLADNFTYINFLRNRINTITETEYHKDSSNYDDGSAYYYIQLKHIFDKIQNPKVLEEILIMTTTDKLRIDKEGVNDSIFNVLDQHIKDSEKFAELKTLKAGWDKIASGKKAPEFQGEDLDGELHSLSDFKGTYVYIDTWATWCGPCKVELPHLEDLQERFKDDNITFISVSIDRNYDDWKNMVTDKNMMGVQLIAQDERQKQLTESYKIATIPRFILIDKEGVIINSNAPRPSEDIGSILQELIDKEAV